MPIEEDSFYDVEGYEVSRTNLVQQMIQYYEEKLEIGETRVTDFEEGSEIRNLLESIAIDVYNLMEEQNELTKVAFVETAEGEWLDKHGANPFINLPRNPGEYATGFVTFTIPEVQAEDILIPIETVVASTDSGLQYLTDSDLIIGVGETSVTGSATCLTVGLDGNCGAETITIIEDESLTINGLTVNNEENFTGGADYEEDEDYKERLLSFVRKDDFGSISYYENLCNEVDNVHDVLFVDETGYTKKCLVNSFIKPTPDSTLVDVLEVLTIPDNIVLGHSFTVGKPDYAEHDFTVNLDMSEELTDEDLQDFIKAIFDGGSALIGFEFEGVNIGQTLTKNSLYETFYLIEYVQNIEILEDGVEITDLTVNENEVLQIGNVIFNQNIVV